MNDKEKKRLKGFFHAAFYWYQNEPYPSKQDESDYKTILDLIDSQGDDNNVYVGAGWMHAELCSRVANGENILKADYAELMESMKKDLGVEEKQ